MTRERVVGAALRLVDSRGLGGLTMRALGKALSVDPMAIYHHVPNKTALLQAVVEAILSEVDWTRRSKESWPKTARRLAGDYRRVLLRHPNAARVVATQPIMTPAGLGRIESAASALVAGGLAPVQALHLVNVAAMLVTGSVLAQVGVTSGAGRDVTADQLAAAYGNLTPDRYPTLSGVGLLARELDWDVQFEEALGAMLLGLEVRYRTPRARRPQAYRLNLQ